MAALSIQQKITAAAIATSGTYTSQFDVTNSKMVGLQINKSGAGKGTAILEWSNDPSDVSSWKAISTVLYPQATATVSAGTASFHLACEAVCGSQVRVKFIEDGTNSVSIVSGLWIGKTY